MKIAIFPGSFDPVTKAHVDIIKRSVGLFDKFYIGIGDNSSKKRAFIGRKTRANAEGGI